MERLITITAETPIYGGDCLARLGGKAVLVSGAIPGETVEARVVRERKDYITAEAVRVLAPSPDRVRPECPYFGVCGGCQLQHVSASRQVLMKEEVLAGCLKRSAKLDMRLDAPLAGTPWNYRRRAQFKLFGGRLGFYRGRSREVVDIGRCPLLVDEINALLPALRARLTGAGARELHVSCGDGGVVALVKGCRAQKAGCGALAGGLLADGLSGVAVEADGGLLIYGEKHITLEILGLKYTVSPTSFFQANWTLNQAVAAHVVDGLQPLGGRTVLDLCAGAGNFSLPLARHAGRVIAVEENPSAVDDGIRNARLNGVGNCESIRGDMDVLNVREAVHAAVVDPPRGGLSGAAMGKLLALRPERIAYVSCDPATLARDVFRLRGAYAVRSVRMADFFPQTYHVEAVAFLRAI